MRTASEVREEWIMPYVKMLKKIKIDMMKNSVSHKTVVMLAKRERMDKEEEVRSKVRDVKVESAKERFVKRTEIRQKMNSVSNLQVLGVPVKKLNVE